MILDEVGALVANATGLSLHTDLFLATTLEKPDTQVGLFETGGASPMEAIGPDGFLFERARIQALSRSKSYVTARNNAERIFQALDTGEVTLSGTRYLKIVPVQSPFAIGRDQDGRYLVSVNFDCWKELSSVS